MGIAWNSLVIWDTIYIWEVLWGYNMGIVIWDSSHGILIDKQ
jgi:hypothetical protein